MRINLIVVLLTYLNIQVQAECENICKHFLNEQSHLCVSETEFKRCIAVGKPPDSKKFKCPKDTVCTNDPDRCVYKGIPVCPRRCGICDDKYHVACLTATTYAFCFNGKVDREVNGTCPEKKICNSRYPPLCFNIEDEESTCDHIPPKIIIAPITEKTKNQKSNVAPK